MILERIQYLTDLRFKQTKVARNLQSLTRGSEAGNVPVPEQGSSGFDLHRFEKTIAIMNCSITDWQEILCLAVYQHEVSEIDTAHSVDKSTSPSGKSLQSGENQAAIGAAKPEGIAECNVQFRISGNVWNIVQIALFVRIVEVDSGGNDLVTY